MQKMVEATAASIGTFSSQNISNAVMAFAKLDHHPGYLMDTVAEATKAVLREATPQVRPHSRCRITKYWYTGGGVAIWSDKH